MAVSYVKWWQIVRAIESFDCPGLQVSTVCQTKEPGDRAK